VHMSDMGVKDEIIHLNQDKNKISSSAWLVSYKIVFVCQLIAKVVPKDVIFIIYIIYEFKFSSE